MRKYIYVCLAVLCVSLNTYAQKETSWWYFGQYAGLNFNILSTVKASDGTNVTNMPKAITGPLNTNEGCFTVSTYDGKLLFSSDGVTVYNKNGAVMPNGTGLLGDPSATQSGIVIPRPGSTTQYYVVTVPAINVAPTNGLRYSIVDMSLNGGLGDVIPASKNKIIKSGSVFENIAAVPSANGQDYWLIHRNNREFYVFPVTATGISTTPNQTVSTDIQGSGGGELIVSSDYTKIVACNWGQIISAEFNPVTGKMSNILAEKVALITYGVVFSPDNTHIYVTQGYYTPQVWHNTWSGLRSGVPSSFLAYGPSNLQIGMDGRVYGIRTYRTEEPAQNNRTKDLYVIMNPNDGGTVMKYFPNYLLGNAYLGLPSFPAGFIRLTPNPKPFSCAGHEGSYTVDVDFTGGNTPVRIEWNFGDGTPIVKQNVALPQLKYTTKHTYANPGLQTILITPYKADGTKGQIFAMIANVADCTLKTNLMTRSGLLNSKEVQ